jgi:hypothetical protein
MKAEAVTLTLPDLVPTELAHTALADADRGVVEFGYDINNTALPQNTTVELDWARGPNLADRIGSPILVQPTGTAVGHYGPIFVSAAALARPPAGATYLMVVVDPSGLITESNEQNNILAVPLTELAIEPPAASPPVLNPNPGQVVAPGSRLTLQVTASNPNPGDPLTYRLGIGAPAGASIDASSGAFSFTPSSAQAGNTYIIPITVMDARSPNLSDTKTLTITVLIPPRVVNVRPGLVKRKGTNVITVYFNESMLPGAAGAQGNYTLVTPIPVRGQKAHGPKSKPVSFTVRYNANNNSVVLTLRKPTKDHLQLTLRKPVSAANGLPLSGDYTVKVQ